MREPCMPIWWQNLLDEQTPENPHDIFCYAPLCRPAIIELKSAEGEA